MFIEEWSIWQPIEAIPNRLLVESIKKTPHTIILTLCVDSSFHKNQLATAHNKKLHMIIEGMIIFFSCIEENGCMNNLYNIRTKYGHVFQTSSTLFTVTNSWQLRIIEEESEGTIQSNKFTHYSIIESIAQIDIIAAQPPIVEWIQENVI